MSTSDSMEVSAASATPGSTAATPTSSAPSPSTASTPTIPQQTPSSAARRPPRKSTLTQQQKNQKRQRATQDQLVTLEVEFNKNPTPTATVRERIAQEINMTERSVQIWFQNRRAKIKMIAKKSIETGEDCDSIPESMRQYLAMQFDPNKPGGRDLFGRAGALGGYGPTGALPGDGSHSGKIVIHHFTCRSLTVGSWRRVGQNAMDLVIFYSPEKSTMTYYINNDSAGYKIEYPFSYIKNISLEPGDQAPNPNGAPSRPGGLVVELNRPPLFYMDSSNSGGFYQCGDFTEDQQASRVMIHHLGGHPKVLSVQLAKLVSLDSFQNRLAFNTHYAVSAPVSPHNIHRPASQPNHFVQPQLPMYRDNHLTVNALPRGHKRQRSRSVPVAVDFSMYRAPMAPFHIPQQQQQQQQQQQTPHMQPNPAIFAPVPQHHPAMAPAAHLRIDTAPMHGVDMRAYPMSATATSMSGFESPFFTTAPPPEPIPMTGTPYTVPYATPSSMPDLSNKAVGTPTMSMPPAIHMDPLIADQSPPLSTMHSASPGDIFSLGQEHQSFGDEGLLSEMYSKHNINFPTASSTGFDVSSFDFAMTDNPSPGTSNDFSLISYDTLNPNSLGNAS